MIFALKEKHSNDDITCSWKKCDELIMKKQNPNEFKYKLLSAFLLLFVWRTTKGDPSSRIVLPQGPIAGIRIVSGSRTRITAYLGIPYALPPIGDLRFAAPARHPGWNATLFAGHFRPDCPQPQQEEQTSEVVHTDEDCLYLNVFVPEVDAAYGNLPVVIFLHGIEYVSGSPLVISAEELATEGLIVVTVGYRLNVFGFLSFEDDFARGNLGILDQYMAFIWVKENIKFLGGSPSNVTVMGHSSGASSIMVHMTSPRTTNLFQRVILMSGSIFSPWLRSYSRRKPVLTLSRSIARSLGCYGRNFPQGSGQTSGGAVSCMRNKSADEILRAFQSVYKNGNWSDVLGPATDDFLSPENQYLPVDPLEAVKRGKFHDLPILTGITTNEGTLTLHKWKDLLSGREEDIRHFADTTAITDILSKYNCSLAEAKLLVKWNYFERGPKGERAVRQLVQLYNDAVYAAPFLLQLRAISGKDRRGATFVYHFAHPSFDYLGNYGKLLNLSAASHGSELSFLFGPALFQKVAGRRFTAAEERLSLKMKRLWASFAKSGNPNPAPYGTSLWETYADDGRKYLKLYIDAGTGEDLRKEAGDLNAAADTLWNSLLPRIRNLSLERERKLENLLLFAGGAGLSESGGSCGSYKNAMFTMLAFSIVLLLVLLLSLILLKKRTKERDRNIL